MTRNRRLPRTIQDCYGRPVENLLADTGEREADLATPIRPDQEPEYWLSGLPNKFTLILLVPRVSFDSPR